MTDRYSETDPGLSRVPPSAVGAPGRIVFERCAEVAVAALRAAAGDGFRLASLSIDVASHAIGEADVEIAASVDKRTSAILFASVMAISAGHMVFSAQALFARA